VSLGNLGAGARKTEEKENIKCWAGKARIGGGGHGEVGGSDAILTIFCSVPRGGERSRGTPRVGEGREKGEITV